MTRFAHRPPVEGAFNLTDHHGRPVTAATYAGRPMLVFFGFTHCRVVCPRALARISEALARLGPAAAGVAALYVTVDPERDTPVVMKAFLAERFPRFTGLTGTADQVARAKASFRVFAERRDTVGGYEVPHTALTYLLDATGRYAAHFPDTLDAVALAEALRSHLTGNGREATHA